LFKLSGVEVVKIKCITRRKNNNFAIKINLPNFAGAVEAGDKYVRPN
jgi:hypothetical protein